MNLEQQISQTKDKAQEVINTRPMRLQAAFWRYNDFSWQALSEMVESGMMDDDRFAWHINQEVQRIFEKHFTS